MERINQIEEIIEQVENISIEESLILDKDKNIQGKIKVSFGTENEFLFFDLKILPEYPLKRYNCEAITFSNIDLLEYGHIMGNGSICIHTSHNIDLRKKIVIDLNSLKRWIAKYFINKEKDANYEHLILQPNKIRNRFFGFLFTEVDYTFQEKEFGSFIYSRIHEGIYEDEIIENYIVQNFKSNISNTLINCKWSKAMQKLSTIPKENGIFVFINKPPANFNKFLFTNWEDLEDYVSQDFFDFLYRTQKLNKNSNRLIPLMVGYKIPNNEIHWQTAILEFGNFPIDHKKIQQKYVGYFNNREILWGLTKNCSYNFFFGRGKLNDSIINSKVLIIGVGAIGSMVAKSLTRGGCKKIDFVDFDIKEPENVCRSEYSFISGITKKVNELELELFKISPFVDIQILNEGFFNFYAKSILNESIEKNKLLNFLNEYDIVFDCSTDNDLLFVLNELKLEKLITLSITNHAKELVCANEPNSYNWVLNQFEVILENDIEDLYTPTGCWSSTFKASHNDISVLVQYAIQQINLKFDNDKNPLKNFVLEVEKNNSFNIKLKEF